MGTSRSVTEAIVRKGAAKPNAGTMTAEMDGYIMSSSMRTSPGGYPPDQPQPLAEEKMAQTPASTLSSAVAPDQAWMTLRVPEGRFETAMKRFATLGEDHQAPPRCRRSCS